jgi:hypothetical protein
MHYVQLGSGTPLAGRKYELLSFVLKIDMVQGFRAWLPASVRGRTDVGCTVGCAIPAVIAIIFSVERSRRVFMKNQLLITHKRRRP